MTDEEVIGSTTYETPDADAPTRQPEADRVEITSVETRTVEFEGGAMTVLSIGLKSLDRGADDKFDIILPDFFVTNPKVKKAELSNVAAAGRKQSDRQTLGRIHNSEELFYTDKKGETRVNPQAGDIQRVVAVAALQGRTFNGEGPTDVYRAIYTATTDIDSWVAGLQKVLVGTEAIGVRTPNKGGFLNYRRLIPTSEANNEKAFKNTRKLWEEVSA